MGTNGAILVDPTKAKCPKSPSKYRYQSIEDAWAKARERSTSTLEIVPYACDGCGNYHLADARNVSKDMVVAAPVGVTTEATAKVLAVPKFEPPARNWDAVPPKPSGDMIRRQKQKVINEFLKDRESATTDELKAAIGVSTNGALRPYMKGWYNTRGRNALWVPVSQKKVKTVNPIADISPKPADKSAADLLRQKRQDEGRTLFEVEEAALQHPAGRAVAPEKVKPPVSDPQRLRIPLSNFEGRMRNLEIVVPGPLTESEWTMMHTILEAMKPGLVAE
jgi:hypothetical protein